MRTRDSKETSRTSKTNVTTSYSETVLIIKILLVAVFAVFAIFVCTEIDGEPNIFVQYNHDLNGYSVIRIVNNTPYNRMCEIEGYQYYEYFSVSAYGAGRWYYEPRGQWIWRCQ